MSPRFHMLAAVHLLLLKENKILLLRRYNTGYEDGNYSVIAGHLDGNETVQEGMCREALEEGQLILNPSDVDIVHSMHRKREDGSEAINYFCVARNWTGIPINNEPEKCDDLSWFAIKDLPDNMIPYIREGIRCFQEKITFSSFGFE